MDYKIIADSACDINDHIKSDTGIELVSLTIRIDDNEYIDDDKLNIDDFLKAMKESKKAPETSCPSIQDFIDKYKLADSIFVVTISSKLSGTYNTAIQAKEIFLEEHGSKFIHVFDSMSASIGETLICLKLHEQLKSHLKNSEVVENVTKYIQDMKTFFLLESMDNLVKNGRIKPIIAKAINILSIKPVMGSENGNIRLVEKVRGYEKALKRLVDIIGREGTNLEDKILGISHCNCLERALKLKEIIKQKYNFKEIIIMEMAGLTTTYAEDGGIVIAF